jgi:hypothetical protein
MNQIIEESDMPEDSCPIKVIPMSEWIKTEGILCKPCTLGIIVQWYIIAFSEDNKEELGKELEDIIMNDASPEETCIKLDELKDRTTGELRDRLKGFDCLIQQNE